MLVVHQILPWRIFQHERTICLLTLTYDAAKKKESDASAVCGWLTALCLVATIVLTATYGPEVLSGLMNPEYYALQQITSIFK